MARRRKITPRVLGVDLSLTSTGLCLPCGETRTLENKLRGWDRIMYIVSETSQVLSYDEPTHIGLEGYAMGAKGRVFDIAELGGIMKLLFLSEGFPIVLIPPMSLKVYACGKGNAKKEFVMKEIKARWGRSFVSSDKADAFALQQYALDYLTGATESPGDLRGLGKAELIKTDKNLQTFANIG